MSKDYIFCSPYMPSFGWVDDCLTMAEWSASWQIIGIVFSLVVGMITAGKILFDLQQIKQSKINEEILNRSKFLLELNRRIYDDEELACVIEKLDNDDPILANYEFSNKSRKLLAFFEEIQYLVDEKLIRESSAHHFFGYYVKKSDSSPAFWACIQKDEENWGLYLKFVKALNRKEATAN